MVYNAENRAAARSVAAQSFVLLKNDNLLPLKKSGTIALVGPLAHARENMTGTWSVAARFSESISVLDGLQKAVGSNGKILYAKGANLDADSASEARSTLFGKGLRRDKRTAAELLREAQQVAARADVIVAAEIGRAHV